MTVAPIAIAAISSVPPRISQRIGPPRNTDVILNQAVPIETIERDRCQKLICRKQLCVLPAHHLSTAPRWN